MSHKIEDEEEEEEEEEEEGEAPVTRSTGFKMVTKTTSNATSQSATAAMSGANVHRAHAESHEMIVSKGQAHNLSEPELRQAKIIAEQKEAMAKAQQEALQRAHLAQQQAIKEAQERAQREAQMRVQQAQAEAKARQAEAEAKARQAQAEAEARRKAEQESLRKAQREAQLKAERERAEQLRAQQQVKLMAGKQAQQAQVQAQRQTQPLNVQQQQQNQPSQQQQPQLMTKQSQVQGSRYQAPTRQVQQQQRAPAVPAKPGQTPLIRQATPSAKAVDRSGAADAGQKIQVMRGGDVQQAYLSNISKQAEVLPQQEVKPIHTQEDQSWVTQNRIPVEIQVPQPAKIAIPELRGSVEIKPTVIVPRPVQPTWIEWNEFPEEETKELIDAPRVKAREWHPDNQDETVGAHSIRSAYQPGRIGHVWPPPQNENVAPQHEVTVTKAADDTAWRRDEKVEVETGTAWCKAVQHNLQRVWPPPENEIRTGRCIGSRLKTIQWPPPEFEQQIQQDIDVLQTRLHVKPNQRQWPPPPPEYGPVVEPNETMMEQQKIAAKQASVQQAQKRTTTAVTKGMVRVGGGR
ncbi:unnamed protein product [Litomosoides sigmodontis]|uniref:Uncharacterized protein n=1 Tax=Litomosoides sigmodontis TaxID=42156 RepID=A0A3P6TMU4_LITSI|nr:unnamed protein product [Litomosoides sigmodontis]